MNLRFLENFDSISFVYLHYQSGYIRPKTNKSHHPPHIIYNQPLTNNKNYYYLNPNNSLHI